MAITVGELQVLLSGDTRKLNRDLDQLDARAGKTEQVHTAAWKRIAVTAAAALAVGKGLDFLRDSIASASDLNETLNKSNVIFGQNAGQIELWASGSAKNFGLSKQAALEAASSFGNMLQQLGFAGDEAVGASTGVVKLAADLGSFNNLETGDVLDRIGAAMRGEYDSLQLLIPNINAARVEQEAMAETGKKNAGQLTAQEKAAATLAIVQRDGAAAANDFAETSGGLANSAKITAAEFANFKAELGQRFLPAAQATMHFLSDTGIPVLRGVADTTADVGSFIGNLPAPVQAASVAFAAWALAGDKVGGVIGSLRDRTKAFGDDAAVQQALYRQQATSLSDVERAFGGLGTGADGARQKLTSVQLMMRDWDPQLAGTAAQIDGVGEAGGRFSGKLGGAAASLGRFARAIGPQLGVAAAVLTVGQLIQGFQSLTQASDEAQAAAKGLAESLTLTDKAADRRSVRQAIEDTEGLVEVMEKAGVSSEDAINGLLGQAAAQDRVTEALRRYMGTKPAHGNDSAEGVRQAILAYDALAGGYGTAASNARYFADENEAAKAGVEGTAAAAAAAAPAVSGYSSQLQTSADAASDAKKKTDLFKLSLDLLTGKRVDMIQIETAFYDAVRSSDGALKDLSGAVLDDAGNLDTHSEAGSKASGILLDIAESANTWIGTMAEQGATADQVAAKDAELRKSFYDTALQMTGSKTAAENLTNQIYGIPTERQIQIDAFIDGAAAKIADIQAKIDNLRGKTVAVQIAAITGRSVANAQYLLNKEDARASGGPVAARTPYLVGEEGQELFVPDVPGTIIDAKKTAAMLAAAGNRQASAMLPAMDGASRAGRAGAAGASGYGSGSAQGRPIEYHKHYEMRAAVREEITLREFISKQQEADALYG